MERGNHVVSLPSQKLITIQEFHHLREQSEQVMEYIDGVVFMAPSSRLLLTNESQVAYMRNYLTC